MFFVSMDVFMVFDSVEEAVGYIEALDADEIEVAFDGSAVPYTVEWITPPSIRRTFLWGLVEWGDAGDYRLVPSGPPNPQGLISLLEARTPMNLGYDITQAEIDAIIRRLSEATQPDA